MLFKMFCIAVTIFIGGLSTIALSFYVINKDKLCWLKPILFTGVFIITIVISMIFELL